MFTSCKEKPLLRSRINGRKTLVKKLISAHNEQRPQWDIIIAGGGITGAGIAREAVRLGLRVLLVERQDFAWGTSSRSSKMVHGGLRYLGQGDYKTTMHSVHERERLINEAPGLVEEMPYVMAHYKGIFPSPLAFNTLLRGYDFFAGKRYRKFFKGQKFTETYKGLKKDNLVGVSQFADAITDDSRLVMRVLHEAHREGADLLNYASVASLVKGADDVVKGALITDETTSHQYRIYAKVVVNATGAWADNLRQKAKGTEDVKIRPTRGSHIVIPKDRLPVDHAFTLLHPDDKRALFIFPWETRTVIGTTDIDHPNLDKGEVGISIEEVEYLINAGKDLFPDANLCKEDIICSWAGVRPLISSAEDGKKVHPSKEKRDHSVWKDKGLISVSGGKLTTFRLIALDVLKEAREELYLPKKLEDGAIFTDVDVEELLANPRFAALQEEQQKRLVGHYGMATKDLLTVAKQGELELIPETTTLWAELRYACACEQIEHLDDLLLRRTRLGLLLKNGGMDHASKIRKICRQELGWSLCKWSNERKRYEKIWADYYYIPKK